MNDYDHAWQAVPLVFASFGGQNKCVALKTHETRFTVPMSSLPGALQRKAAGRQERCCIKDSSTGTTRIEAVWGDERRSLVDVTDCGSIGFASLLFLLRSLQHQELPFPGSVAQSTRRPQRHDGVGACIDEDGAHHPLKPQERPLEVVW